MIKTVKASVTESRRSVTGADYKNLGTYVVRDLRRYQDTYDKRIKTVGTIKRKGVEVTVDMSDCLRFASVTTVEKIERYAVLVEGA